MSLDLSIDFETASRADLRKIGAHAYARHPSTMVLCMAWAFGDEPVTVWRPGQPFPMRVKQHVHNSGLIRGWNVTFEWLIWTHVLRPQLDIPGIESGQLRDTMAQAAYWGLPLKLDAAASAARANIKKDAEGHRLMLQMCRPRAIRADDTATWWHQDDPQKYDRLCAYCATDVEAERDMHGLLPPLPDWEERYWQMDLEMNARGVPIDLNLVAQLQALARMAAARADLVMNEITYGAVRSVNAARQLMTWLRVETFYPYEDLKKQTVAQRLSEPTCEGLERHALELRQDNAKTSVAKLGAMLAAADSDGRVRGMLQYMGAVRTGRWAGRLVQMQNIPRGSSISTIISEIIEAVMRGHGIDVLEMFYSGGLDIVMTALRGCITPPAGRALIVADFSQIEARVLAWLSGQWDMLQVFASGEDPYVYAASLQRSTNRAFGKVLVLALGYGMGWERFIETAKLYGVTLEAEAAQIAVTRWRDDNSQTRQFWWDCDRAAKDVIRKPGKVVQVGKVRFSVRRGNLIIRLPSDHMLVYRDVALTEDPVKPEWEAITYNGLNQFTRRWERQRTWGSKLVENITQALARDVMAEACLAASLRFLPLCLMVHDELIGEADKDEAPYDLVQLLDIMQRRPTWGLDLPIAAVGWTGPRYKK